MDDLDLSEAARQHVLVYMDALLRQGTVSDRVNAWRAIERLAAEQADAATRQQASTEAGWIEQQLANTKGGHF